jgi:ABC-type multidrug transport system fused ATPase/permease subunit
LSGGQRQRIALARALLRNAPLLLLDEATSQIDLETERSIVENLLARARKHGQTVLLVTHRMSMAVVADEVWVIAAGHLVGRGRHAELLETHALYARLHRLAAHPEPGPGPGHGEAQQQVA